MFSHLVNDFVLNTNNLLSKMFSLAIQCHFPNSGKHDKNDITTDPLYGELVSLLFLAVVFALLSSVCDKKNVVLNPF